MDDPWRMRSIGSISKTKLPTCPHRRSTGTTKHHRRKQPDISGKDSDDFSDVFGGPPRIILTRQFSYKDSGTSSSKLSFYKDIFRPMEPAGKAPEKGGRSLPEFRIPGQARKTSDGFYSDIFGCGGDHEINYNDAMSSPEISPLKPSIFADDDDEDEEDDVSLLTTKLRPINVRTRTSSSSKHQHEDDFAENDNNSFHDELRSYAFGLRRKYASPETVSLEPISTRSFKLSADDLETKSPSSSSSSSDASLICRKDTELIEDEVWRQEDLVQEQTDEEEEEDEVNMSSYVIEISSDLREGSCESNNDIDEAIAWAKERFQRAQAEALNKNQLSEGCIDSLGSSDIEQSSKENPEVVENQTLLDEKIKLWSTGKEADIRLLLSSLHHILWPNSGWSPKSIADLIEISQVKKAYQKARLCLHPDKLQQRGAARSHKYIADKAFSILQDSWSSFVSRNICDEEA